MGIDLTYWKVVAFLRTLDRMGYHWYLNSASEDSGGYGGTAVITRHKPEDVHLGLGDPQVDEEG